MSPLHILLFGFVSAVLGHQPCVDYSDVCVPTEAIQRGCHCALIRPGQEASARESLRQIFGRKKRDLADDFRFSILSQSGVNELNRVFPAAESAPTAVDNNVFAWIYSNVHSRVMTVPTNLVSEVVKMQSHYLSPEAQHQLLHCGGPKCESIGQVTDLLGNPPPTHQHRNFRVVRAVRYDLPDDEGTTLIAISMANTDFFLNKKLVLWTEKKCKTRWFRRRCWDEPRSREDLRVFDDNTRYNWINHVNRGMISKFRINHGNLLA